MPSEQDFPIIVGRPETLSSLVGNGIAVDIDETLSDTMMEWVGRALVEFGNPENLTPEAFIAKYRYIYRAPYLATPEVERWRYEQKYSNDLQMRLPVIPGALDGLRAVDAIVPVSCYVTARPAEVMSGTQRWLMEHGFPEAPLVHSPEHVDHSVSHIWKGKLLESASPRISGIIDDHPALIDALPASYAGGIFLYNVASLSLPRPRAYACPDWDSVVERVREAFPS